MTLPVIFLVIVAVGVGVWFVTKSRASKEDAQPVLKETEPVAPPPMPAPMPERRPEPQNQQFPPVPPVPPMNSGV